MWKIVGYVCLWLAGSGVAVSVAWAGVAAVDDNIVPAPASVGAADPVGDELAVLQSERRSDAALGDSTDREESPPATVAPSSTPPTSVTDSTAGPTASTSSSAPTSTTQQSGQSAPTTSIGPTPTAPSTTEATPSTTEAAPSTTAATTSTTEAAQTQTFQLVGGTTAISFSPTETRVLWATPNPGFEVEIESESPGMKVEFRSEEFESRIDVWWSAGPQHDIRERDR